MPASSVVNVMLLPKINNPVPESPKKPELESFNGLHGKENIITWNQVKQGNIMTYEVWFSEDNNEFKKINPSYFFDNAYIHALDHKTKTGYYKVRAIDFQNRKGAFSHVISF